MLAIFSAYYAQNYAGIIAAGLPSSSPSSPSSASSPSLHSSLPKSPSPSDTATASPLPLIRTLPPPSISPPHSVLHSNPPSSSLPRSSTELKILSFNARSLFPMLDELKLLCLSHSPDIICITETWLSPVILNTEFNIPGHTLLHLDRDRHGGCVAMLIISSLSPSLVSLPSNSSELLLSSITHRKYRLFTGTFYHPPSYIYNGYFFSSSLLSNLSSSILSNLILVGDFNVNYVSSSSSPLFLELKSLADSYSLSPSHI